MVIVMKKRTISFLVLLFWAFMISSCTTDTQVDDPLTVSVQGGSILGTVENDVHVFKGVPFAAPPIDELRFAPPQPLIPWEGTLDCTSFRDMPVQTQKKDDLTYGEDCLYLNIWSPPDAQGKNLPVLVFIHGGAFSQGASGLSLYNGSRFAQEGVIQVNIEYRLNALGFLVSEEIEEQYGYLGNAGILDQIVGLQWVQDNIAQFGGDPNNVTISGESAGSFSVSNLILSPLAHGLFNKAIMESGNILGQPVCTPLASGDTEQAILTTKNFMAELNVGNILDLQKIDSQTIANASKYNMDVIDPYAHTFWPVFDGKVLPKDPYKALVEGNYNKVDILAGFNTDEGSLFVSEGVDEDTYIEFMNATFGENASISMERFPVDENNTPTERTRYIFLMGLRFGSDVFADQMTKDGQKAFLYQFDYKIPLLEEKGLGVMHALELGFVFDSFSSDIPLSDEAIAFKEEIHNRWLNFIVKGNPNLEGTDHVVWPEYTSDKKEIIVLGNEISTSTSPDLDHIDFFKEITWENKLTAPLSIVEEEPPKEGDDITPSDYGNPDNWLVLTENPEMPADVFVLYPTAWTRQEGEGPICSIDHAGMHEGAQGFMNISGSAFVPVGNVFAPYYRQLDATFVLSKPLEEQFQYIGGVPKTDVMAAFDYYIKNLNQGRPFILVSHSQGSTMAKELLFDYMKENPQVVDQMVAAYVLGYSVTKQELEENPHVKFAEGALDTGVIISYNTEAPNMEGNSTTWIPGSMAINPISWSRDEEVAPASDNLGSMINQNGTLVKMDELADAKVDIERGVVICSTADIETYSMAENLRALFPLGVYHGQDIAFYYYNLRDNAQQRISAFMENN